MGDVVQFRPRAAPAPKTALPPNVKRDALIRLMDVGVAMVHLDARKPGVMVPAQYAKEHHLRLNFAWAYKIRDLDTSGPEKLIGSLSFAGRNFRCELPWSAIFAITSDARREMSEMWLAELPDELGKTDEG